MKIILIYNKLIKDNGCKKQENQIFQIFKTIKLKYINNFLINQTLINQVLL